MEQNIIKIKCSYCGSVLKVVNTAGIDQKTVICPVCKQKLKIGDCERVEQRVEKTDYPMSGQEPHLQNGGEKTSLYGDGQTTNYTLGRLTVLKVGTSFQLKPGRNIVGRKTSSPPHADFEIVTNGNRMSRQHVVIEVKKVAGQGFVHYISLCGQKANATFVGDNRLEVGDCLVLNDGDILKLPDMPDISVLFEIPNSEKTIYD